jgi:hypothetical protein
LDEAVRAVFVVLVLLLASSAAVAEEWVVLRKPAETGESAPAGISVDSTSIEILGSGLHRAKVKVDFLSRRLEFEKFDFKAQSFTIWSVSYDCDKHMSRDDSMKPTRAPIATGSRNEFEGATPENSEGELESGL